MTQEIQWGPAIAVDGKRPEVLKQADTKRMRLKVFDCAERAPLPSCDPLEKWGWDNVEYIKLPADHPHYRQTEAAVPEGMKAWHGGDAAPADWDSEKPIAVIDDGKVSIRYGDRWDWSREPVNAYGHKLLRVVAYTPVATPIDWSGELEAVHEDGRVVRVRLHSDDGRKDLPMRLDQPLSDGFQDCIRYFNRDGSCNVGPWRIRNVPQPTPQADTKPDLTARIEALVRQMAVFDAYSRAGASDFRDEARAIVALLPEPEAVQPFDVPRAPCMTISEVREMVAKGEDAVIATMLERGYALPEPVDEDLVEARECVAKVYEQSGRADLAQQTRDGRQDIRLRVQSARLALARGRALALAGEKEA